MSTVTHCNCAYYSGGPEILTLWRADAETPCRGAVAICLSATGRTHSGDETLSEYYLDATNAPRRKPRQISRSGLAGDFHRSTLLPVDLGLLTANAPHPSRCDWCDSTPLRANKRNTQRHEVVRWAVVAPLSYTPQLFLWRNRSAYGRERLVFLSMMYRSSFKYGISGR